VFRLAHSPKQVTIPAARLDSEAVDLIRHDAPSFWYVHYPPCTERSRELVNGRLSRGRAQSRSLRATEWPGTGHHFQRAALLPIAHHRSGNSVRSEARPCAGTTATGPLHSGSAQHLADTQGAILTPSAVMRT
jgi:hypothetical protein